MAPFLSEDQLKGFEKYKYNSIDTSILSNYVMHPFWNWCVQFCPEWVAPNMLTFLGFVLTVHNFLLFSYYDYGFYAMTEEYSKDYYIPWWVWASAGINLFGAYTLDGIDGKQARRTGTSGPLGELFDHGLDSYSAVLIPTFLYSIFGRDELSTLRFFFLIWNVFLNFYLTHWEKYNTGVMFLPWGYDFTMIGSCILLLVTSAFGPKAWHMALPGGVTGGMVFEFVLYVSAILSSQTTIVWNIYKSYRDGTGKMRSFSEAIRPLVPLFLFFVLSSSWAVYSPNNIIEREPRIFYLLAGTIFSNMCMGKYHHQLDPNWHSTSGSPQTILRSDDLANFAGQLWTQVAQDRDVWKSKREAFAQEWDEKQCRLIVSQMSDTRCEVFNALLIPYGAVVVSVFLLQVSPTMEVLLLSLLCVLSTVAHIYYGTSVVNEMCRHFKINCFHIKPNKSQ